MTVQDVLRSAAETLARVSGSARLDAEVLLADTLDRDRAWLRAHGDDPLDDDARDRFDALVARRAAGEPVAYLTGEREFWSLAFEVSPAVLIPRPDTETLVAAALEVGGARAAVADLGTGSGAVAVALAHERPAWRVVATDRDDAALAIARRNAARHGVSVEFRQGDWCGALGQDRYDLIVSNPPYVRDADPHLARGDVRFEPRTALAAGPDGLDDIRRILACARAHLGADGWLLLEHGHDQADAVAALMEQAGYSGVRHWTDLGGIIRVTGGT